jgi:hypothetical protein
MKPAKQGRSTGFLARTEKSIQSPPRRDDSLEERVDSIDAVGIFPGPLVAMGRGKP